MNYDIQREIITISSIYGIFLLRMSCRISIYLYEIIIIIIKKTHMQVGENRTFAYEMYESTYCCYFDRLIFGYQRRNINL